jgi:hypothetical protein
VKTYDFLVGIYDPFGMIFVITPPTVSIPKLNGVASITISPLVSFDSSPQMIPP